MAGGVGPAVRAARAAAPDVPLEVECRDPARSTRRWRPARRGILLDNMPDAAAGCALRSAAIAGRAETEASGGDHTSPRSAAAAEAGVDFISSAR